MEENILHKANQKRNLDRLVMDKGNFHTSKPTGVEVVGETQTDSVKDLYTKDGILEILGVADKEKANECTVDMTTEEIETAMANIEDSADADALKGVRKEAVEELKEFDESIDYKKDSDDEDEPEDNLGNAGAARDNEKEDEELERQIAAWQDKVGLDAETIKASLSAVEKYGLRFHEDIDPFVSSYANLEEERKREQEERDLNEIDIDEIELQKSKEEQRAFDEGDLLWTNAKPEDVIRQRNLYIREKARLASEKRYRQLTGANWQQRKDESNGYMYWYNADTGEATWDRPTVLLEMDDLSAAQRNGWCDIPQALLVRVMGFLAPFPDRMACSTVCRSWRKASCSPTFVRHVYPVEQGAYTMEEEKMESNHFRTIAEAVKWSLPGDTIGEYVVLAGVTSCLILPLNRTG